MKRAAFRLFLPLTFILTSANETSAQDSGAVFFDRANLFFLQYADSGTVNYALIRQDRSRLDSLLAILSRFDYSQEHDSVQKAYLINAYNLFVIETVISQYPIRSPRDVSGFFDRIKHKLNKTEITLDDLENRHLGKRFSDARIHFALVCGAKGCPPVTAFAYQPAILNKQLNAQVMLSVNNPDFIRINDDKKEVLVSEIFKWYESDFVTAAGSILAFVNNYRSVGIPKDYAVGFYDYDWHLNDRAREVPVDSQPGVHGLQLYTPSVLLSKGRWEYKIFNNLYTQTSGYDSSGNKQNFSRRSNYFTSIHQLLIGINPKVNVGMDIWIKSVRNDVENSSPLAVFRFENDINSRTALSGLGPKIKLAPFKRVTHFSVQTTLLIPVAKDQEGAEGGKPYLSADRFFLITQLFYDKAIGTKFQLFFQFAPWISIEKSMNVNSFNIATPVDAFFSWFPTTRITVYIQNEWWPAYGQTGISSWFRQEGVGVKYQIIPGMVEAELLYTRFTMGRNAGAGQTYNVGFRIIR